MAKALSPTDERDLTKRSSKRNALELVAASPPGRPGPAPRPTDRRDSSSRLRRRGVRVVWRCHVGADAPERPGAARLGPSCARTSRSRGPARVLASGVRLGRASTARACSVIPPSIDPFSAKNECSRPGRSTRSFAAPGIDEGRSRPRTPCTPGGTEPQAVWSARRGNGRRPFRRSVPLSFRCRAGTGSRTRPACCGSSPRIAPRPTPTWCSPGRHRGGRRRPRGRGGARRRSRRTGAIAAGACAPRPPRLAADGRPRGERGDGQRAPAAGDVVVQKSLAEGFGLTVAEAMWKARPGGRLSAWAASRTRSATARPADWWSRTTSTALRRLIELLADPSRAAWRATRGDACAARSWARDTWSSTSTSSRGSPLKRRRLAPRHFLASSAGCRRVPTGPFEQLRLALHQRRGLLERPSSGLERLGLPANRGAAVREQVEDRVDGCEHTRGELPLETAFTLDHLMDELQLVLHRLQELLRHLTAPGD